MNQKHNSSHSLSATRRELAVGAAAVAFFGASSCATATTPAEGASTPARVLATRGARANLDAALRDLTERELFSGVVMLARQDEVLFSGAYGLASREYGVANTVETQFNLGSGNKMFTATSIMRLHESGRLNIDDTVDRYLDDSWLDPAIARQIRLTNFLTHTGGLTDYFSPQFEEASRTRYRNLEDYKPLVRSATLMFEPGSRWMYSNTGFLLLGVIVANVTGQDFYSAVRSLVFEPAGMTHTGALDLEEINTGYAQGYYKEPLVPTPRPGPPPAGAAPPPLPTFQDLIDRAARQQEQLTGQFRWRNNIFRHVIKGGPGGGMFANAPDMLRFCNALKDGVLVSRATADLMQSPKPPPAAHWGYGMMTGDGAWGHGGSFAGISSQTFMYPDGYRTIILSNVDDGAYLAYRALLRLAAGT